MFEEDFRGLPLGVASTYPYTAEGRYHVVDRRIGRWTEATIHFSWFEPLSYASPLMPINWSGDGSEFLFLSVHPVEGGLLDAHAHRAVMFPDDGHPFTCCTALDLTGDGRDELLTWDTESIWIYRADMPLPDAPHYRPIRPPHWNESNHMAHVSLPRWE